MDTATLTKNDVQIIQQAFADFGAGSILNVCTNDVIWSGAEKPGVRLQELLRAKMV